MSTAFLSAAKITPDKRQREAIEHIHGPMIVLAGAGTGKTTVLIQRIARLVREGHARPNEILALTYTENAADEMKTRVRAELRDVSVEGLETSTFHAWCNNLLKRYGAAFQVLDDKDLWVYLRQRIRDLQLKHFVRAANVSQFLDDLLEFMRRCQDELVGPQRYAEYVARLERREIPLPRVTKSKKQDELTDAEILERCREIARVFATVEDMLRARNLGTFGHMITGAYRLLKSDPALLEEERSRIRFLLVDEFQDANFAQIEILSLVAGAAANVFVVGDPDQAIYQFRGASSEAFSLFLRRFPSSRLAVLDKNRRSLPPILQSAFGIVNENPPVFAEKASGISYKRAPLESAREIEARERGESLAGEPIEIVTWCDKEVEAADLAGQLRRKRREFRCPWSDFAVLYRQHTHREDLVQELAQRGVPFSIEGLDVLDTPEVRDLVACLTSAVSPNDAASLFRVAALPQFKINPDELRAAMKAVRREELDLRKVLAQIENGPAVLESVDQAHQLTGKDDLAALAAAKIVMRRFALPLSAPVRAFLKFVEAWQAKPVAETRSASEFLEYLELFGQAKGVIPLPTTADDAVRLMTAHAAKGLEFRHVVILRGSSNWFPCGYREPLVAFPPELRASQTASHDDKMLHEQEERRLFYVAMTRAKVTLTIYANQGRGKQPSPTKFLRDLMTHPAYRKFWRQRPAAAVQDDLFAAEEQAVALRSNMAAWLLMPPLSAFTGLSATAIEIYQACPLRFKLEREWNLPRDVSASLHYGAAMHRVLRTFYDARQFGRTVAEEELMEMFRADLAAAGIADRYQYDLYLRQGIERLQQFFASARQGPQPDVLHTEQRFELTVGDAKVTGRVDRIDRSGSDSVDIVDYKTGKPRLQDDADESLQLSLYALAAKEVWGQRAARLIFYNLENNTAVFTTRCDAELEEVKEKVEDIAGKISRGEFAAKPGYQCRLCPYRNFCPETEKVLAVPEKRTANRTS